jgi:hypothetical protein
LLFFPPLLLLTKGERVVGPWIFNIPVLFGEWMWFFILLLCWVAPLAIGLAWWLSTGYPAFSLLNDLGVLERKIEEDKKALETKRNKLADRLKKCNEIREEITKKKKEWITVRRGR